VIEIYGASVILTGMTDEMRSLLEKALKLSPDARAALAGPLLDSLDQEIDEDAESAWSSEIAKRVSELDSGKVRPLPWSEVRRRLLGA
jgi:putative addiction module component (TIGR02574 family)